MPFRIAKALVIRFRERLADGEKLDALLPEAFAVVIGPGEKRDDSEDDEGA